MNAYPRYFLVLLWIGFGILIATGLLLAPGIFELRLEWEVPWTLPGGSRSLVAAAHGLGAMVMLVLVGALLPVHVRAGLRLARNFVSGIVLLTALAILGVSGWAIYYVVNEDLSAFASLLHLGAGLAGLVPFALHAIRGRRIRLERALAAQQDAVTSLRKSQGRRVA